MGDRSVEEVRVAMALNGGVSLAIWMGGSAVEIDCARRADLGPEVIEGFPTRSVYAAICGALDRRLVVDVMSGSSAGGINGALLAAASVGRRRLHPDYLRTRWLELGDASRLLHPLTLGDPFSLMSGVYFHTELLRTFDAIRWEDRTEVDPEPLNAPAVEPPVLEPPPFLDVTTTDVAGAGRRFADVWGGEITALEYRARFRFRENSHYTAGKLAAAARSSASFPLAFEPFKVDEPGAMALAGFTEERSVIDGGLLDNAPIAAAIDLIKARPARGYVKRYLCYVNGEPKDVTEPLPEDEHDPEAKFEPRLPRVLANVLGIPRKAPFADQLKALEDASWRGEPTYAAELALLRLDLATLQEAAAALLGVYRDRRRLVSLRELIAAPARKVWDALGTEYELPWIPQTLHPPAPGEWGWGVQAARRVHHLAIDLIREALRTRPAEDHAALLAARAAIDDTVTVSEARRREALGDERIKEPLQAIADGADPAAAMSRLSATLPWDEGALRREVVATAQTMFAVRRQLDARPGSVIGAALFGPSWEGPDLTDDMVERFLERVLGIEVVRRAFAMERDIDDGQRIAFAQLTPSSPCPLLDEKPVTEPGDWTPESKLTGIRLAHFAAFHRRSWRANDYLWGRMDGAARVVAMLLDAGRARDVADQEPWVRLAHALVPDAPDGERWEGEGAFVAELHRLAHEALADAGAAGSEPAGADDLRSRVAAMLRFDLLECPEWAARGSLTRVMCIRAAQLEVLAHELPSLIEEADADARGGASSRPLELPPEPELLGEAVARMRRQTTPLPVQLARDDPQEIVSNLALRTMSRSALVSLALLRGSTLPLMQPLQVLRALFLAIAGLVAGNIWNRAAVLLAFISAELYLAARAVAVEASSSDVERLSWNGFVLTLVAVFLIAGVAVVPILRAWGRRTGNGWLHAVVAGLLLAGTGVSAVFAAVQGTPSWADALVAGSFDPPAAVFWIPFLLVLGTVPKFLPRTLGRIPVLRAPWHPVVGPVLAVAGSAVVGGWSAVELLDGDAAWWVLVGLTAAVVPIAVYVMLPGRAVRPRRVRSSGQHGRAVRRQQPALEPLVHSTPSAWREQALAHVADLQRLTAVYRAAGAVSDDRMAELQQHLYVARKAARGDRKGGTWRRLVTALAGAEEERVARAVDAVDLALLRVAPDEHLTAEMPRIVEHAQRSLSPDDPRRIELEALAGRAGAFRFDAIARDRIAATSAAAKLADRRQAARWRSFHRIALGSAAALAALAVALAVLGFSRPSVLPLCFATFDRIACPSSSAATTPAMDADAGIRAVAEPGDIALVELLGLIAGALGAAVGVRRLRGTSVPTRVAIALAVLKPPAGALTAVLGLLLMRGDFIPGFGGLDTSGQILAWAIVFGYAQLLFTQLVDMRATTLSDLHVDLDRTPRAPRRFGEPHAPPGARAITTTHLNAALKESVPAALRQALSGPVLTNYRGWVAVRVHGPEGRLAETEDRRVTVVPGRPYSLGIAIGPERQDDGALALRITEGSDALTATFAISIKSDDPGLEYDDVTATIETTGGRWDTAIPLSITQNLPQRWLWVRVSQRDRLVLQCELRIDTASTATTR